MPPVVQHGASSFVTLNTDNQEEGRRGEKRRERKAGFIMAALLFSRLIAFYGSLSFFFFLGTTQIRPQLPHSINKAEIYLTELNEVIVKLNDSLCT